MAISSMTDLQRSLKVLAAVIAIAACTVVETRAQSSPSARVQEEALIRRELERIIAENPEEAANASKALDKLGQPETSAIGRQMRNRRQSGSRRIVNGLPAQGHPAVGAILKGADPRNARAWCTGTLVGCDKFLTAAHCVAKDPSAGGYLVFLQDAGFLRVSRIDWPKDQYQFPYFDLAMLTLEHPVEGVAPISINMTVKPINKSSATIVGFGRTGGNDHNYGVKREGTVLTQACPNGWGARKLLCWAYDADVKALRGQSNTCNGDSGGSVLMADEDEAGARVQKVFGVVSGGLDKQCVTNDLSYNVDVREFKDWLLKVGEGRLSARECGPVRRAGGAERASTYIVQLAQTQTQHLISLEVPAKMSALRVALNGEDAGAGENDFDLLLFKGADGASQPVCRQDGSGQFAFCEIRNPESGSWTAAIQRKLGDGLAQVTVTMVPINR